MSDFTNTREYEEQFDPRLYLETYFHLGSGSLADDFLRFVLDNFNKTFKSGAVKGSTLIDIGTAPSIYQLLSACECFDDITVTWHTNRELKELQKWLNNEADAFDWSSIVKHVCEIEGKSMGQKEKEEKLKGKIKKVFMCDVSKSNPLSPHEVPKADCLLTTVCLEAACKNYESYGTALKNLSNLLKPKGHLLMAGDLGANYYEVGSNKVFSLPVNEKFLKKVISESGYEIIQLVSFGKPENADFDTSDYEGFYFVHAQKV
ncbi:nicotinamide N-methyltransferase-like [Bufo gargarizans]|uniref:nicotinamide N-methyltransferase-like n=1 Tax=Bufo gargarizans TaxID=30331 RepID=UPI001CF351CE|nr:nicotinamide N-methyltransferase-like [Bufo gargarizans]WCO03949.1 indolethylamine N-methyltransferase-like protein 2 [Bufo gargarizans]